MIPAPPPRVADRAPLDERVLSSPGGRFALSVVLVITLTFVLTVNMPDSALRRKLLVAGQPYLDAIGLDQNWALFAPEPRREALDLQARVTFRDGSTTTWRSPRGGALLGPYWDYRWVKWVEYVSSPEHQADLWRPAAAFIAREEQRRASRRVARVVLIRQTRPLVPPGAGAAARQPATSADFYTYAPP